MNVTFRPLDEPERNGLKSSSDYEVSRFDSSWSATLNLLDYELERLGGTAVVIKLALEDKDIRRDGWPRAGSRPTEPTVIVEWQTSAGQSPQAGVGEAWSQMVSKKYTHWHDNVRAVALTLQALRSVERWGAVEGQQYEGLRLELEASASAEGGSSTSSAQQLIDSYGGLREALKATHPDQGGDLELFRRVQEARKVLGL